MFDQICYICAEIQVFMWTGLQVTFIVGIGFSLSTLIVKKFSGRKEN